MIFAKAIKGIYLYGGFDLKNNTQFNSLFSAVFFVCIICYRLIPKYSL